MKKLGTASKWSTLVLTGAAMALGITALLQSDAHARRPPQPDCGPTRQWNCVRPGCPDCPEILFEGTVCEKTTFEQRTRLVCS